MINTCVERTKPHELILHNCPLFSPSKIYIVKSYKFIHIHISGFSLEGFDTSTFFLCLSPSNRRNLQVSLAKRTDWSNDAIRILKTYLNLPRSLLENGFQTISILPHKYLQIEFEKNSN